MKRYVVSLSVMCRWVELLWSSNEKVCCKSISDVQMGETVMVVSSDLDGYRGALKREVFFHTFLCVLV